MALSKLGDYIELADLRNREGVYSLGSVRGISIQKCFISTKANMKNVSLSNYKVVSPDYFAYVTITSRNGEKISLTHNDTDESFLVSSSYLVFKIKDTKKLLPKFLYMYFNRPEFDRFSRFNSWGSAREAFSWDDMCDIDIDLPPLEIQQKHVDVYNAMVLNQKSYEQGLEDLKLTCDAYIDRLRRELLHKRIGEYLIRRNEKNRDDLLTNVMGVSVYKVFRKPTSKVNLKKLTNYKIVYPRDIAFVQTTHNEKVFAYAYNNTSEKILVSSVNEVFRTNEEELLPEYLSMFFSRSEFDRYARYHSWGSARETFTWNDLIEVKIPIPDIEIQKSVVNIYNAYHTRREINEKMKAQIKDLCPILIKGSISESQNGLSQGGC